MWKKGWLPENPVWLPRAPREELRVTQMGEVGGVAGTPEDHCQEKCPNVPGLQKLPREEGQGGPFPVKEKHEDRRRAHEGMTRRTVRRGREQGRGQKCGRKPA